MNLTICVACSHPANEHDLMGCNEILDWEDGAFCGCPRTEDDVYRQHVPVVAASAGEEG